MFDRSQILRSAWAAYRVARPAIYAAGDTGTRRVFLRSFFAKMLRRAWDEAKKAARTVNDTSAAFRAAERRVRVAAVAAMDPAIRSARISAIRDELTVLDYAPWGVRTVNRRAALGAELEVLRTAV